MGKANIYLREITICSEYLLKKIPLQLRDKWLEECLLNSVLPCSLDSYKLHVIR